MTLKESKSGYLEDNVFKMLIANAPLVSIDFIVKREGKVLLGKRCNRPAQGYWFTLGGRVMKQEPVTIAIKRIGKQELGIILPDRMKFIGVFEHFYDNGIFEGISTHYLNLGYEIEVTDLDELPMEQHDAYHWFGIEELLQSSRVHHYVKDYFTQQKGTVPQY
jgi:colanic acid biosynthesis protein WcaH